MNLVTHKKFKKANEGNVSEINPKNVPPKVFAELVELAPLTQAISASMIPKYHPDMWRFLLGVKGVYQLPTIELIDFLRHLIGAKSAIEICCGHGTVAHELGIPAIDRKLSEGTGSKAADAALNMTQTSWNKHPYDFPDFVENLTAYQAIEKYSPQVVIGCWVTQKSIGRAKGSAYGVEEDKLLEKVETYIHCGSSANPLHTMKHIRKVRHWTIQANWLYDRSSKRGPSQLKVWTAEEPDWDAFPQHLEFDIL